MLLRLSGRFRAESAQVNRAERLGTVSWLPTFPYSVTRTSCDFFADSPAGTQWKPTLTLVVFTGKQPVTQRSTGSTEKHLDSWPWMFICFSSCTDSSFIRHSVKRRVTRSKFLLDSVHLYMFVSHHSRKGCCWKSNSTVCFTSGVPAALCRQNPGMSVADCALGQASIGCAVLLSDFPISPSAESTGLSLHPVHNFNLHGKIRWDSLSDIQFCQEFCIIYTRKTTLYL